MTEPNNPTGGPFFPIPPCGTGDPRDGMTTGREGATLLDYFAGQALAGMESLPDDRPCPPSIVKEGDEAIDRWRFKIQAQDAETCYAKAGHMLRARQKLLNEKETQ